ncbi:hypothetical protein C8N24_3848 [Solirubrobacter pauli]|uniref:Lipoprotein n=1 Tax=Solirubrobacter pauli TaxID=166793 RepID=A0A660LFV8_9ACTN|nr:hypothetical protein [Solirubrobacter pauli]RKQ93972.1 hypothetical protein C8N24_3848 [Solirubrobacter pauli]
MSVRPATLAALLLAVCALLVAACGDDEPAQESGAAPPAATQDADAGTEPEGEAGEEGESEEEREREEEEAREATGKPCTEVGDIDGEPENQPPDDVTILDGAKVYESEGPFGKTERFFAAVDGETSELVEKRDAAASALEGSGFKILSTDQEEGTEAEAHLEGDGKTVDIQVISLCEGKLRIRYTVS